MEKILASILIGLIITFSSLLISIYAQDQQESYQKQWINEQSKKQFDKNDYVVGGLGVRSCPDIEYKHDIIFVKYPTGFSQYEVGCNSMTSFYEHIKGYKIISVDKSEIFGITVVKLSK